MADQPTTFAAAREKALKKLEHVIDRIRFIAADPTWNNTAWAPYREAVNDFNRCLERIVRLNNVQTESEN